MMRIYCTPAAKLFTLFAYQGTSDEVVSLHLKSKIERYKSNEVCLKMLMISRHQMHRNITDTIATTNFGSGR